MTRAISYGEWISPEFVAEHVQADRKIVWIHSDIDKALFFNEEVMFRFDDKIDLYLFASDKSMETALARYPIMQGRATVVHNLCDDEGIRRAAMEKAPETEKMKRPLLLTVANFRAEKNHLRQVEAMALLKKRGLDFTWLNIGSDTDTALISQIDAAVKKRGLEGRFIRMSAQASPYRFMKNADAVCVLSDFESWSLVISEAKLVGTPVIATRTSGAIEQIEDGETGVLCDFTPEAIADGIERLLKDAALQSRIRKALEGFSTQQRSVQEFTQMLADCPVHRARPSLLYVSDNINYVSGVQRVTATQVQALRRDFAITVFSMEVPDERSRRLFAGVPIVDMQTCCGVTCLAIPCRDVLLHRGFTMAPEGRSAGLWRDAQAGEGSLGDRKAVQPEDERFLRGVRHGLRAQRGFPDARFCFQTEPSEEDPVDSHGLCALERIQRLDAADYRQRRRTISPLRPGGLPDGNQPTGLFAKASGAERKNDCRRQLAAG